MDTHISELAREQDPPENQVRPRVSLPGEARARGAPPHEPPVPDAGQSTVSVDPAERLIASPPLHRRRRAWLLATATVSLVAGAGFLLSPYNTVFYPGDAARLRTQGQNLASAASAAVANLVAPSAQVARALQPVQMPPPQRQVVAVPSRDDQMREILALRDRTPNGSSVTDGPSPLSAAAAAPAPPASTAQAASASLGAASPALLSPLPASSAAPSPGAAQVPAAIPPAIPGAVTTRQPNPLRGSSPPPLTVFETGAAPAAAAPPLAPPVIADAQSSAAAAPAVLPPPSVPAIASASDSPPPPGQGFEPAVPIDPVPAAAPRASPAQSVTAIATATEPARAAPATRSLSTPNEVIGAAAELRAAPMTPAQQIEVLNLVAKLGVVVRDMRVENAALKSRVESTADRVDAAVADFDRRLALAEAKGAVNAAMGGDAQESDGGGRNASAAGVSAPSPAHSARAVAGTGTGVQIIAVSNTAAAGGSALPRYRVTAASPGLAMLSLLDRSGGEGSQLQVAVGDQVPGYGRVTAIQQRGSAWIVQTDKGPDKGVIQ